MRIASFFALTFAMVVHAEGQGSDNPSEIIQDSKIEFFDNKPNRLSVQFDRMFGDANSHLVLKLENCSERTLSVEEMTVSCSCAGGTVTKSPISPGAFAELRLIPKRLTAHFSDRLEAKVKFRGIEPPLSVLFTVRQLPAFQAALVADIKTSTPVIRISGKPAMISTAHFRVMALGRSSVPFKILRRGEGLIDLQLEGVDRARKSGTNIVVINDEVNWKQVVFLPGTEIDDRLAVFPTFIRRPESRDGTTKFIVTRDRKSGDSNVHFYITSLGRTALLDSVDLEDHVYIIRVPNAILSSSSEVGNSFSLVCKNDEGNESTTKSVRVTN